MNGLQIQLETSGYAPYRPESRTGSPVAPTHRMLLDDTRLNDVTGTILSGAIEVHRVLGPGLFESTYGSCLHYELQARGLPFLVQPPIDVLYKSLQLQSVYRADLIVADMVVVEIKAVEALTSLHRSQLLTYVRLARKPAGLLINFNVER